MVQTMRRGRQRIFEIGGGWRGKIRQRLQNKSNLGRCHRRWSVLMTSLKDRARTSAGADEDLLVGSVRSIVSDLLITGYPDLRTVACKADITARTLQRCLASAGLTYSDLVTDVRLTRARELIGDRSRQIEEIAAVLGYSDAANFTRAFKKWAGVTPSRYRKSLTGTLPF